MNHYGGARIVLTAPLTGSIAHAGFFIQMSLASIPGWMEWVIDKKYPTWREVPTTADGRAGTAPAGLRVLEAVLAREFGVDEVVVCYPDQLPELIGERTRVVAVSTHNPLGTTFAAGVYASLFGSSRETGKALYPRRIRRMADRGNRHRGGIRHRYRGHGSRGEHGGHRPVPPRACRREPPSK